jgi:hypothetical protein
VQLLALALLLNPVAHGTLSLPAAQAFGEPGFHQVLVARARLPTELPRGTRVVLTLRDVSRPGVRCSSEHPLSGCATVDWADDPSRPKVPSGGVFRNALTMGGESYFLSESGRLARRPDAYTPG